MESKTKNNYLADQLTRLAKLFADGALTKEEFAAFKSRLIFEIGSQEEAVKSTARRGSKDTELGYPDSTADYSHFRVDDILRPVILRKFVQDDKIAFYQSRFRQLIDSAGIGNQRIMDVDFPNPLLHPYKSHLEILRWKRFPFVSNTQWNWAAFFFYIFWGAWRGVSNNWWMIASIFAVSVVIDIIYAANGISEGTNLRLATGVTFGVAAYYGAYGNQLFLAKIVDELKSGRIRYERTSTKDLCFVLIATVGYALISAAYIKQ